MREFRLRKMAAALAVVVMHGLVLRALWELHDILTPWTGQSNALAMTWIYLPPEPAPPGRGNTGTVASAPNFTMTPLFEGNAVPGAIAVPTSLLPPSPPVLALPPLAPLTDANARTFAIIGDYFACDFANFDKLDDDQRRRCALRFSHLGDVALLPPDYVDGKSTPFSLFGAHGTFAITPPSRPSFKLIDAAAAAGCTWDHGLCEGWRHEKFGFDPSDPRRGSAAAHFELAKGLSLDAGGQAWMQNYLGGARLALAAGVVLTYRW